MPAWDKLWHLLAGFVVGGGVTLWLGPVVGLAAALGVGCAKEIWDAYSHGTVELADALWTTGGGVLGAALIKAAGG
jgi:hypothetical protein